MSEQVITITAAEAAAAEETITAQDTKDAFIPSAPVAQPAAYNAGTTYAKGALVVDGANGVFRSLAAGNKGNTPHEDAEREHWVPVAITVAPPLVNPAYGGTSYVSGG